MVILMGFWCDDIMVGWQCSNEIELQSKYIQDGFNSIQECGCDFAFSVTTFAFPVQRSLRIKDNGVEPIWSDFILERSQDLEEAYHDAGQFYWGKAKARLDGKKIHSDGTGIPISPRNVVDLDNMEDLKRAELIKRCLMAEESV